LYDLLEVLMTKRTSLKGKVEFLSLVYDATILQLWQKGYQYPVLAQVAEIYLAISSSLIPVEAVLHNWNDIRNSKRSHAV